ncbi:MAG TPA: hypothetical protein VMH22_12325 [bacterium]|nr:hypothetical protein [bacterium]
MGSDQTTCFACGQHKHERGLRHKHGASPVVIIAACLLVAVVLGGAYLAHANAAKKQAAQLAEQQSQQSEDASRQATRQWRDAERAAKNDDESRGFAAELDDLESRYQSTCTRVASQPTPQQKSIMSQVEAEMKRLRRSAVYIATTPEEQKPAMRDSIHAGEQRVTDLTNQLSSPQ